MKVISLSKIMILFFGILALTSIVSTDFAHAEQDNPFNFPQFAENIVLATHSSTSTTNESDSNSIKIKFIKGIYQKGDTVYLYGIVKYLEPNPMVVTIYGPSDDTSTITFQVQEDRRFQISYSLIGDSNDTSGIYTIKFEYGDATLVKHFWFKSENSSQNFTDILAVGNLGFLQNNCVDLTCEQIPRVWGPQSTTFTWFNPSVLASHIFIVELTEPYDSPIYESFPSSNIFSYKFEDPGEYAYQIAVKNPGSNFFSYMIGLIYIDENLEFSSGTVVMSSSTTTSQINAFTSAQIDSSSATYSFDNISNVKVPQGTSVPGCESLFECFTPSNLVIDEGTTVIWSNDDSAAHTITSGSPAGGPNGVFDSSLFMAGTTFSHAFDTTGSFEYFCMVHPWMAGRITVLNPLTIPSVGGSGGETCNNCSSEDGVGVEFSGFSPNQETSSGDNQWDTRPTFGVSHETRQGIVVENGFRFNTEQFTLTDNHHTDFAEQSIEIGTVNSFSATVYADKKLKIQEFLFGIPNVGEAHLAELGVEIWYDIDGEIEDVVVVQKSDVIDVDTVIVTHQKTKCLSTDSEAKCDTTTVSMTFLEPLNDKVMAIKAIDYKNRDQRTYLNDGFDITGESLNPKLTKMIPSTVKNEGLLKVTQVSKYSSFWEADDERLFEMNSFGSFKQINQEFKRFQDSGEPRTRLHSGFGGIIQYEQNRALEIFDSTKLISELPDSFGHYFEIQDRINDEIKHEILLQEQKAQRILDNMDRQKRDY